MRKRQAFTLIELLVVISIIALLIGILLPALGVARRTARQMQSNTQVRGIHQAMVTYAQGNNSEFPGLNGSGAAVTNSTTNTGNSGVGDTVEARYWILLNGNYFTGEYAVSPVETRAAWTTGSGSVTTTNYSYGMLMINGTAVNPAARKAEWKDTINTEAAVMSDRAQSVTGGYKSIHTTSAGDWRGSVGYNDNHVIFETTDGLRNTRYGSGTSNTTDTLFVEAGTGTSGSGDALIVFTGTNVTTGS